MDQELNRLIDAWKICMSGAVKDANVYQEAFQYVENFKENSPHVLDIGFLLYMQKDSFELAYFGVQLILHVIKFKWNMFDNQLKLQIKSKLMNLIGTNDADMLSNAPNYLKNGICTTIIELIKRELPQNWPNFLNEMFEISNQSMYKNELVFFLLKFIAEEFIENESSNCPAHRRKDINYYLNLNMESLFDFYFTKLRAVNEHLQSKSTLTQEICSITNSCLDSFNAYLNWFKIEHLTCKDFIIINVLLEFLNDARLAKNALRCLITLINRKGTQSERKPTLKLFDEPILTQLIHLIKVNFQNQATMKLFIQLLVGMGHQLNYLWSNEEFEPPAQFKLYVDLIFELAFSENLIYSSESIQIWNTLLANKFISKNTSFLEYLVKVSQLITNSYILFKNRNFNLNDFDSQEDFYKFFIKYRVDLARLIKSGSNIMLDSFFNSAFEWAGKILVETSNLKENEVKSGYDSSSFLYLCWDALIYLWTSMAQTINKKLKENKSEVKFIEPKICSLITYSVEFKSSNANYTSFNLSLLSCVVSIYEKLDQPQNIFQNIIERLFMIFDQFQTATTENDEFRKHEINVRRQTAAMLLNVCKSHAKQLQSAFESIFNKVGHIVQASNTTQLEKIILIQALIYCTNEFPYEMQSTYLSQFLNPIFAYLSSIQNSIENVQMFVRFYGLDESMPNPDGLNNRKQLFYNVNLLYSILKCYELKENAPCTLKENLFNFFMSIFDLVLNLSRCFNELHEASNINRNYLGMTDAAKMTALGMQQSVPQASIISENDSEKILMFTYNLYDTLNQIIGLYLSKFKQELLMVQSDDLSVIYKIGKVVFGSWTHLPNFRIRSTIRYILKPLLMHNFDKEMVTKRVHLVRMNETFLEHFLPAILTRINETNKANAVMKSADKNDDPVAIQEQIVEENQFVLMCRETVDLIKTLCSFTADISNTSSNTSKHDDIETDEMDEMSADQQANEPLATLAVWNTSELAQYLISNNRIFFQSLILCVFEGLNWPDSYCCFRLVRVGITLFEKFQSLFNLSAQMSEQTFRCCLCALQIHGEHQETVSLLINFAYLIYEKSLCRELFQNILAQIPNINMKLMNEFVNVSTSEKVRKDLFKKIVQPIVGKSVGQLYKNDIVIRALKPIDINRKQPDHDSNNQIVNICSLFDPNG
jgi:exportin-5